MSDILKNYRRHLLECPKSTTQGTASAGKDMEKKEATCTVSRNANWCNHYNKQYGEFSKS